MNSAQIPSAKRLANKDDFFNEIVAIVGLFGLDMVLIKSGRFMWLNFSVFTIGSKRKRRFRAANLIKGNHDNLHIQWNIV